MNDIEVIDNVQFVGEAGLKRRQKHYNYLTHGKDGRFVAKPKVEVKNNGDIALSAFLGFIVVVLCVYISALFYLVASKPECIIRPIWP